MGGCGGKRWELAVWATRGRGGRRLGGWLFRVSHTMVVYACTKAAIITAGGAMTSAKSPSLRFVESAATKPIPTIHLLSRMGRRQRGQSDIGDNDVIAEECRGTEAGASYCVQRTRALHEHIVDDGAC